MGHPDRGQLARFVDRRRVTLDERIHRVRDGLGPVLQTAAAAALAWLVSTELLGHPRPIFAPLAAIICLGATRGQHWQRAIEMVIGVAVGIGVADALVLGIGRGAWQIALVAALAMLVVLFAGGGPMVIVQAGISAALVVTLDPIDRFVPTRFFDALVGGGAAILLSQLIFPFDPRTLVAKAARPVFQQLVATLGVVADALEAGDAEAAGEALQRARAIDGSVRAFNDALTHGHEIARLAPPRRRARGQLEVYAVAATQVDLAVRNTRVLARAARGLIRRGGPAPGAIVSAVRDLAEAVRELERCFDSPETAQGTRDHVVAAVSRAASVIDDPETLVLSSVVGQIRLAASDLMRATGLSLKEANEILDRALGLEVEEPD